MEPSSWPKHRIRAQGRSRAPAANSLDHLSSSHICPAEEVSSPDKSTESQAVQLLNFLSRTAAASERALLGPAQVPDFACVKDPVFSFVPKRRHATNSHQPQEMQKESEEAAQFAFLADEITRATVSLLEDTVSENETVDAAHMLDDWLGSAGGDEEGPSCPWPRKWPDNWSEHFVDPLVSFYVDTANEDPASVLNALERAAAKDGLASGCDKVKAKSLPPKRLAREMRRNSVIASKVVEPMADGKRQETFSNGASLLKDALGRVVEIRSIQGTIVSVYYSHEGDLETFVRFDEHGQAQSFGERDRHGVVVRDPQGRVMANGESMTVDPSGCLSIRRYDGQFWSLDLVREQHTERRKLTDKSGRANTLTAVFALDGFRMMTRFQRAGEDGLSTDEFRFYGRDGSVVHFASEDGLADLKASTVFKAGSRPTETKWRGPRQASSAWDSVQEYFVNYLKGA